MKTVFDRKKWRNCSQSQQVLGKLFAIAVFLVNSPTVEQQNQKKQQELLFFSRGQRANISSFIVKKEDYFKSAHEKGKGNERLRAHATAQREKIESATMEGFVLINPNEPKGADSPSGKVQQNTTRFF